MPRRIFTHTHTHTHTVPKTEPQQLTRCYYMQCLKFRATQLCFSFVELFPHYADTARERKYPICPGAAD
jgi:hypothetical protein